MRKRNYFNLFTISAVVFVTLALIYAQFASTIEKAINGDSEEATVVSISISDGVISPGEQFIVGIYVEPNTQVAGLQFDMSFDPSLVSANSIGEGDFLTRDGINTYFNNGVIDNESGTITGVYGAIVSPGKAVSTGGAFATITLTAGMGGVTCPITLSNVIVGDLEGNAVPVNVVNGELEITQV